MKKHLPVILLIIVSASFMLVYYGKPIFHPNDYLFNNSGDAIKNYYTYAYHIRHDGNYINFSGMNYPYGEHFLYTDCHPVLANLFKGLSILSGFFDSHSIGILNFLMLFSIFLTFVVCYYLLREFSINSWFSALFALGICLLAPQLFRLGGHLSLSYSVAIPFSWLLLLLSMRSGKKFLFILLFINTLFWMFIHAYLGVIIISFLGCILLIRMISERRNKTNLYRYLILSGTVLLPLLLFYAYLLLTDTHTGRSTNPAGFFLYNAELDDIFLPNQGPTRVMLDKLLGNIIKQQWEAWSYVGISTTFIFIAFFGYTIVSIFRKKARITLAYYFSDSRLNHSLLAAGIILLFAMGFPFKQLPQLLDYMPLIRQFRATGRFDWPFFFVAIVFSASALQKLYDRIQKKQGKILAFTLIILFSAFNIAEGLPYHSNMSRSITTYPNLFDEDFLPGNYKDAIKQIDPAKFQAIIALPFYYQGSGSFERPRDEESVRTSIVVSYYTGLPNICANLSRTSIPESRKIVQLVSPDHYMKPIRYDFKSSKPFLIVRINSRLTANEDAIIRKAHLFFSGPTLKLYSISPLELFRNSWQFLGNYKKDKAELISRNGFYMRDTMSFFYYNGFENKPSTVSFRGNGAFSSAKSGKNTLAEFNPGTFSGGREYAISMWMNNRDPDALNDWFRFMVEEYDAKNNRRYNTTFFPDQAETIEGDWSLVEGVFRVIDPGNMIFITTKGKDDAKVPFYADELLIRETGNDIYRLSIDSTPMFYNNQDIRLNNKLNCK